MDLAGKREIRQDSSRAPMILKFNSRMTHAEHESHEIASRSSRDTLSITRNNRCSTICEISLRPVTQSVKPGHVFQMPGPDAKVKSLCSYIFPIGPR